MFNNRLIIGCTFLWLVLCLPSFVISQTKQTYKISWSVLDEGGKTEEATSASYRLKDAIGQPVIGKCKSASYKAYVGFWATPAVQVVGIEEKQETGSKPYGPYGMQETRLFQNYPNPFSQVTEIRYTLKDKSREKKDENEKESLGSRRSSLVSLRIYDLTGRLVRTLVDEQQKPGYYKVTWNGKDDSGSAVAPGVYFYRLIADDYSSTKKTVILR
ncbi:MAG TPA: T9SS type A sorting domain-containing protein [bacterium (Candidatus Stahlbacteria)]|nr:T9SS type A sorting domain-containing protein [Candidatus Stahlbacteria bacterium]